MARTRPPFTEKPVVGNLAQIARELRLKLVEMSCQTKSPLSHDAISSCDLLVALYWQCLRIDPKYPDSPGRDRFICNHENAVTALYATLAKRGFFPLEELIHYGETDSRLPPQPLPGCVPGIEWACSSSADGLSVGQGMALAAQIQSQNFNVYVLLSDRTCQGGTAWEAVELAPRLNLGNLTAIIQSYTKPVERPKSSTKTSLMAKWQSHGWAVREVDGHDISAIADAIQSRRPDGVPVAILANTTKGKGLSFVEDDAWQDRLCSNEDIEKTRKELSL